MVERVNKYKEKDEYGFSQLMDEYLKIALEGRKAIEKGRLEVVGQLMNENQLILAELGVSDESNDKMNAIATEAGALGAKVTGGGGGGCCISLAEEAPKAQIIAARLNKAGYQSFCTKIWKESRPHTGE